MNKLSRNVRFVLVGADGFVVKMVSVPKETDLEAMEIEPGQRIVLPADGVMHGARMRLDLRKLRQKVNRVGSLQDVVSSWRPQLPSELDRFEIYRGTQLDQIDVHFARLMDHPLSALHAEKRRQAEAGGGRLVVDEADRLAILANAAEQDEAVATLDRQRRDLKARVRAATTEDEIKAILADI